MPKTPRPAKTRLLAKTFERVRKTTGLFRTPTPKPGERREIRETILGAIGSWERTPPELRKQFTRVETSEVGLLGKEKLNETEQRKQKEKKDQIRTAITEAKKAEHTGQPRDAIFHFAKAGEWKEIKRILREQTEKTRETFTGSHVIHLGVLFNDAARGTIQNHFLDRQHANEITEKLLQKAKAVADKAMFVSVVNLGPDRLDRMRIMQGAGIIHAEIYKTTRALINASLPETEHNARTLYRYREMHAHALSAVLQAETELKRATYLGPDKRPWEVFKKIVASVIE
ncbi:MAG: hypothetical protein Q7S92_04860 [Candidatus Diapherotrites archaeon]|nr:hypothetical protein [Candidatus Diapherotrites archaeon]